MRHHAHLGRVQLSDEQLVHVLLQRSALSVLLHSCLEKIVQFRLHGKRHVALLKPVTISASALGALTFHIGEAVGGGGGAGAAIADGFLGLLKGLSVDAGAPSTSAGFRRSSLWYAALILPHDCCVYRVKHSV
jgi:hypothetical protein